MYDVNEIVYTCRCSANSVFGAFTTAGDICILDEVIKKKNYSPDNAKQISYSEVERNTDDGYRTSSASFTSGTMEYFFLKAAVGC